MTDKTAEESVDPTSWEVIEVADLLNPWVTRVAELGCDVDPNDVMSLIVASSEAESVLRIVETDEQSPTGDPSGGPSGGRADETLRQFVPHTRVFFQRPQAVDLGMDALTAASVYIVTGSGSLASGLTMLRRTFQTFRNLSSEEMDVVLTMRGLCGTRDRNRTTITVTELNGAYLGSPLAASLDTLTASLLRKRVITRTDDGWRLVP